jgi:hypothetical protein
VEPSTWRVGVIASPLGSVLRRVLQPIDSSGLCPVERPLFEVRRIEQGQVPLHRPPIRMSLSGSLVGLECMAALITTRPAYSDSSSTGRQWGRANAARLAVGREFARILEERHPGIRWLPTERTDRDAASGAGEFVHALSAPENPHSVSDIPAAAARTPDIDHVDRAGQEALTLSRR